MSEQLNMPGYSQFFSESKRIPWRPVEHDGVPGQFDDEDVQSSDRDEQVVTNSDRYGHILEVILK